MAIDGKTHEKNRKSWNAVTLAHNSHKGDQAAFLRQGGSTLFPEELDLLGEVRDLDLAHLLCNCGQDSLSLASLGARVVGVDISDEAVAFARQLSRDSGVEARFDRSDAFDWLSSASEDSFDLAFCSYGAICWLSDLERWARGVAAMLRPGGALVVMEFHPLTQTLDENLRFVHPYFGSGKALQTEGVPDYVGESGEGLAPSGFADGEEGFENPHPDFTFPWSIAQLVSACLGAGLAVERLEEYPYSNGAVLFEGMRLGEGRRWHLPESYPSLPLMLGLRFRKTV